MECSPALRAKEHPGCVQAAQARFNRSTILKAPQTSIKMQARREIASEMPWGVLLVIHRPHSPSSPGVHLLHLL
jgi:hypothetical protein